MKLSLFTTKEQQTEYYNRMADDIEKNGLKQALEAYEDALQGKGRELFFRYNNMTDSDYEWEQHISWLQNQALYLKRKVKKYRKLAQV